VPPGDPRALADALCEVLGDEEVRRAMAEAARRRSADFDIQRAAELHAERYAELAGRRRDR
jgi:glycosyltransferase involved in cell wall biosynthesis